MTGTAWCAAVYRCPVTADLQLVEPGVAWQERLPASGDSDLAERYRQRWLLRPPSPLSSAPIRAGLVRFTDPTSELLLAGWVGSIAVLDAWAGRLLAGSVPEPPPATAAEGSSVWARPTRLSTALPGYDAATLDLIESRLAAAAVGADWRLVRPESIEPPAGLTRLAAITHPTASTVHFSVDTRAEATLLCDSVAGSNDQAQLARLLGDLASGLAAAPGATRHSVVGQRPAARIDERVLQAAAADPDAVALVYPGGRLSYRELVSHAQVIAARLRAASVGRGDLVGVSLGRGEHLVPALLGTMLAGAAYVPLDPGYPAERLAYIRQDAGITALIALDGAQELGLPVIDPRADRTSPDVQPVAPPGGAKGQAGDAAYVIYTSGSTGRPKGVVVEHRNVDALLAATEEEYGLGPSDVWTMFHSYAFDFSVWEIWGCLCTGGRLVIVPADVTTDPQQFRQLLHREGVTVLNQTPSAFTQLLSTEGPAAIELVVRLLVFGGEKLDSRSLLGWFDRHPESRCRVMNMYGITETTVHSSLYELRRLAALRGTSSVGVALDGWRLHVLDEAGNPVAPGELGEIYVGGAGVTRGYLNRPALTAERFIPDHLSGLPGARLYRSGDRGRLRADGEIEHHGRLDGQVKIRGYRIELDEISSRIQALEGVSAAVVVLAHRGEHADAHLDAYVVGSGVSPDQVRKRLASQLPAYMLPSTITPIDRLPLTSNGKVDRARLPAPALHTAGSRATAVRAQASAAAAESPDQLAAIWQRVLGVPVGHDDNFFLIGGNSVLAIRLMTSLREAGMGAGKSVRLIYENPTVDQLSRALAC